MLDLIHGKLKVLKVKRMEKTIKCPKCKGTGKVIVTKMKSDDKSQKWCSACNQFKIRNIDFYTDKNGRTAGRCKTCMVNRDKALAERKKRFQEGGNKERQVSIKNDENLKSYNLLPNDMRMEAVKFYTKYK